MGAIVNGMTLYGSFRAYGATFLIFSDYMRPAVRLAALMKIPSIFVYTHDSVFLGEDGPTHQPVEQLWSLRLIPNLTLFRPADGAETAMAWAMRVSATRRSDADRADAAEAGPHPARPLDSTRSASAAARTCSTATDGDITFIATGSEVPLAVSTAELLRGRRTPASSPRRRSSSSTSRR